MGAIEDVRGGPPIELRQFGIGGRQSELLKPRRALVRRLHIRTLLEGRPDNGEPFERGLGGLPVSLYLGGWNGLGQFRFSKRDSIPGTESAPRLRGGRPDWRWKWRGLRPYCLRRNQ